MLFASIKVKPDHYYLEVATDLPVEIFSLHYKGKLKAVLDLFSNSTKHKLGHLSECVRDLSEDQSSR